MLVAMLILGVTVELQTSEPIRQPTVLVDGKTMEMRGDGRRWSGNLEEWPALISATFEDLAGNRGSAEWDSSWTPTPTVTPAVTPTDTPPPRDAPVVSTATATPAPASPEIIELALVPTVTSTPTISPTVTRTPTPTIVPHSWQTTGGFGWRYTGEILEATHARFEGHDGFILDGLDELHTPGEPAGKKVVGSWETLPGRHTITYRWRKRVRKYEDVIEITFRENGWPVDTEVVSEDQEGRIVSDGMSPEGDPGGR
jgi:hypothetical protein